MTRRAARGRPTIYKGADGLFHCYVELPKHSTGQRNRVHVKRKTRALVTEAVAKLEKQKAEGLRKVDGSTVEAWFWHWIEVKENGWKPATARSYRTHVKCYVVPRMGSIKLAKLTTEDIERMLSWIVAPNGKNLSASTAAPGRPTVVVALKQAGKRGRLVGNPAP